MNFQRMKVLEDGSTSGSDDRFYEPSIKLRNNNVKEYKKKLHIDQLNKMLHGYLANGQELDDIDMRLLFGLATKVPPEDIVRASRKLEQRSFVDKVYVPPTPKKPPPPKPVKKPPPPKKDDYQDERYDRVDVANISGIVNPVVGNVAKVKRDGSSQLSGANRLDKINEFGKSATRRESMRRSQKNPPTMDKADEKRTSQQKEDTPG